LCLQKTICVLNEKIFFAGPHFESKNAYNSRKKYFCPNSCIFYKKSPVLCLISLNAQAKSTYSDQMLIIADCGSTKCDWLVLHGGRDQQLENTIGFSPFFHSTAEIKTILTEQLLPKLDASLATEVYFYGTGVHDEYRAEIVAAAFRAVFTNAKVEVEHDLLGAARAVCGRNAGIACILGTGSNSCYFDGERILDNVPSLGWLLGDEGSGTHLGKAILTAWFYRELPADLQTSFNAMHPEGQDAIKDKIYEKGANSYLATFTKFLGDHINHPFVQNLVAKSLGEFIDRHVCKYNGYQQVPINFVGSIAFHFQPILEKCLENRNLKIGKVVRKPIYSLADFHLQQVSH
jgi:N-acetylglucosamine kinase-like BadF-type ATPase